MVGAVAGRGVKGGITAKEPPERDALAGAKNEKMITSAEHELVADGDMDGGHVADIVGDGASRLISAIGKSSSMARRRAKSTGGGWTGGLLDGWLTAVVKVG